MPRHGFDGAAHIGQRRAFCVAGLNELSSATGRAAVAFAVEMRFSACAKHAVMRVSSGRPINNRPQVNNLPHIGRPQRTGTGTEFLALAASYAAWFLAAQGKSAAPASIQ
jgi:hypothetical protein